MKANRLRSSAGTALAAWVACVCAACAIAGKPAVKPATEPALKPALEPALQPNCEALAQVKLPNVEITRASAIAANRVTTDRAPNGVGGNRLPAHCLVRGDIDARTGADGKPYAIGFELRLPEPAQWTGRFFFQGGGGNDGVLRIAEGTAANMRGTNALERGFAVVSTDSGHLIDTTVAEFGDALFGLDPQARIDFGHRAIERVSRVAQELVARHYGRAATKSYFAGCSNGGRQGFVAAQRYPDLFDGIVAGDPSFAILQARIASFWQVYAFKDLATGKDPKGRPDLSSAMSEADLALLNGAVMQRCDALDGLKDGMIDNLPACRFDPSTLQCTAEKTPQCLSAGQVAAVKKVYAGPHDSQGRALYATQPPGAERAWRRYIFGDSALQPGGAFLSEGLFKFLAFTPPDPSFDFYGFDFDRDPQRLAASRAIFEATGTDFTPFQKRGGKLLIYHGTADPAQSADFLAEHYRKITRDTGGDTAARSFARLFFVPGMEHCFGGEALENFDVLTPIVEWVEKGTAPAAMTATGRAFPGRSRPLCPFPQRATYLGSGSTEDAANFTCR